MAPALTFSLERTKQINDAAGGSRLSRDVEEAAGGGRGIKSVHKAIDILDALAASRAPLRVTDLAEQLRMSPSSVSRLVATLRERGLVESDPVTGRCYVGLGAATLGNAALGRRQLDQVARPWIADLSTRFEEHVNLSRLYRGQVVYQRGAWADGLMRAGIQLGGVLPVHCTAPGKALIAWLPEREVAAILDQRGMEGFTANTITSTDAMLEELARVRRTGLAHDIEELAYGIVGVGAPIWSADRCVAASLSTGMPAARWLAEKQTAIEQAILYAAHQISREIGYTPPSHNSRMLEEA